MGCKLIVSELANSDLVRIIEYIIDELKSPAAATNLLGEIEDCYANLKVTPLMYEKCKDARLAKDGYRKAVIKNYLLIYRYEEATRTVKIVRYFYGGRDYERFI